MRELLIATTSAGKTAEIMSGLVGLPFTLLALKDLPQMLDVDETEPTFEGNAILKAKTYAERTGILTLADDSGLEVDALDGAPGVLTARYAPGSDENRYRKLLETMKDVPDDKRGAQFTCVMAVYDPVTEKVSTASGIMRGRIVREPKGTGGFGYDPVFFNEEAGKMHSEETMEDRARTSHRGKALAKIREVFQREFV